MLKSNLYQPSPITFFDESFLNQLLFRGHSVFSHSEFAIVSSRFQASSFVRHETVSRFYNFVSAAHSKVFFDGFLIKFKTPYMAEV